MRQMENTISIPVIILTLGVFSFVSLAQDNRMSSEDHRLDSEFDFDHGLGKRVYDYLTEFKRQPFSTFGLRSGPHLYNFGLGKRQAIDEDNEDLDEYDEYFYKIENDQTPELELYQDNAMQTLDPKNRFEKRPNPSPYNFGLGKRLPPTVNRDKLYNFGLGKRNSGRVKKPSPYSFGIGKRAAPTLHWNKRRNFEPDWQNPNHEKRYRFNPYNFGLGRRSEDSDVSRNVITKREVREENPTENENKPAVDSTQVSTNKLEKFNNSNNISKLESHEIMGHSSKSQLSKRSPYRYNFESAKSPIFRGNAGFSRQFRKPLYSFGLGKRTSLNDVTSHKSTNN